MAALVLGLAGASLFGGGTLGAMALGIAGSFVDKLLFGPKPQHQTREGPRLDSLSITSSTEGMAVQRMLGLYRVNTLMIWATNMEETVTTTEHGGKGGLFGGGGGATVTEFHYFANFAIGLCEGPIDDIVRAWADGKPINLSQFTYRLYKGSETQGPDPLIQAKEADAEAEPVVIGPNLVVDPEFTSSANWTEGAGWSIAGGQAVVSGAHAASTLDQNIPALETGQSYIVEISVASVTAGSLSISLGGGSESQAIGPTATPVVLKKSVTASSGANLKIHATVNAVAALRYIKVRKSSSGVSAYRGLAYMVFERMPLEKFGNRIPNLTVEVLRRPVDAADPVKLFRGVSISGLNEFALAPDSVSEGQILPPPTDQDEEFTYVPVDQLSPINVRRDKKPNFTATLDTAQAVSPDLDMVNLPVVWFGSDLRCEHCTLKPKVSSQTARTTPFIWQSAGLEPTANAAATDEVEPDAAFTEPRAAAEIVQAVWERQPGFVSVSEFVESVTGDGDARFTEIDEGDLCRTEGPEPGDGFADQFTIRTIVSDNFMLATSPFGAPQTLVPFSVFKDGTGDGGTPADRAVVDAIKLLKERGLAVMLTPTVQMDIGPENGLGNPYSDDAEDIGQPAFPPVSLLTCSPAAGFLYSPDKTSIAADQIDAFYGTAAPADFGEWVQDYSFHGGKVQVSGGTVPFAGEEDEWSYSRFVLHYANIAKEGGFGESDAFLIGAGLKGLTRVRSSATAYPFVTKLIALAAAVREVLPLAKISYAADWDEFMNHRPDDGSDDVLFHLDPLWADGNIDFVGINFYPPLSDWRAGLDHLDAQAGAETIYNADYLTGNVMAGEDYDWRYLDSQDRDDQVRTDIADADYAEPWVFRHKDLRNWWGELHHDRPGGIKSENLLINTDDLVWSTMTAVKTLNFGTDPLGGSASINLEDESAANLREAGHQTPAIALGAGDQIAFSLYCKVDAAALHYANIRMGSQALTGTERIFLLFRIIDGTIAVSVGGTLWTINASGSVDVGGGWRRIYVAATTSVAMADFAVRVFPGTNVNANWPSTSTPVATLGSLELFGPMVTRGGLLTPYSANTSGASVELAPTAWVPESKPLWFTQHGCAAMDKGTNQPDAVFDEKSGASALPYYSTGDFDPAIQYAFFKAVEAHFGVAANNPDSSLSPTFPMVERMIAHTWSCDHVRFIELKSRVLNQVAVSVPLKDAVADICGGLVPVGTRHLYDIVQGYYMEGVMSRRAELEPLMQAFLFDAYENDGTLHFRQRRHSLPALAYTQDDLVDEKGDGNLYTLTRAQETDLPRVVQLNTIDPKNEDQRGNFPSRRLRGTSERTMQIDVPLVMDKDEAEVRAHAILYDAWLARERAEFILPPSSLALVPTDVISLTLNGRPWEFRIGAIGLEFFRPVKALQNRVSVYDVRAPSPRTDAPRRDKRHLAGPASLLILDLPLFKDNQVAGAPLIAAYADPWDGVAVYRSSITGGFTLDTLVQKQATVGRTKEVFNRGPTDRWDRANELIVKIPRDHVLQSLDDELVMEGKNLCAVRTGANKWEVLAFANAELIGAGRYRLSRLLRGLRGSDDYMKDEVKKNSAFVLLNEAVQQATVRTDMIGTPLTWRYGPASAQINSTSYRSVDYTFQGVGLRPPSPRHLRATRIENNDILIGWTRRSRLPADAWEPEDVHLSEEKELYRLRIFNDAGEVVQREVNITEPQYIYTWQEQRADFGSIQTQLDIGVRQRSVQWGLGAELRETVIVRRRPVSLLAETRAFIEALSEDPPEGSAIYIDNFIRTGRSAGWWPKMACLYVTVGPESMRLVNWIDPSQFRLASLGQIRYRPRGTGIVRGSTVGLVGNFSAAINNGMDVTTSIFTQDDNHMGVISASDLAEDVECINFDLPVIRPRTTSDNFYSSNNDGLVDNYPVSTGRGHFVMSRRSSSQYDKFVDGVLVRTVTNTTVAAPAGSLYLCGQAILGLPVPESARLIQAAHVGSGVTVDEASSLSAALDTIISALIQFDR